MTYRPASLPLSTDTLRLHNSISKCRYALGRLSVFPVEVLRILFSYLTIPALDNLRCTGRGAHDPGTFAPEYESLFSDTMALGSSLLNKIISDVMSQCCPYLLNGVRLSCRSSKSSDKDIDYPVPDQSKFRHKVYSWTVSNVGEINRFYFSTGSLTFKIKFTPSLFIHGVYHKAILKALNKGKTFAAVAEDLLDVVLDCVQRISIDHGHKSVEIYCLVPKIMRF